MIYGLDDMDMIGEKTQEQEKKNIQVLLDRHFDNQKYRDLAALQKVAKDYPIKVLTID